ncbi:MAG: RNA-binding transcriptional accessory protein [Chloroflexi bacterium]|nr:RNA-binding transcriptional accessory protein [Chloroflexota bacterium]
MNNHAQQITKQLNIRPDQVTATIELLDDDNTLPFIARYRKEVTGGLDEEQIRQLKALLTKLRAMDERRQTIISTIESQGKLTPELHQQLLAAETRTALEDLYQPYKPKRRTRASIARKKGLQDLADLILEQDFVPQSLAQIAAPFLTADVPTVEDAWTGARDIVAETISDHAQVRQTTREKALQWGTLRAKKIDKADDPRSVYEIYYDFEQRVNRLRPHQAMAISRGEADKVLRVHVDVPERDWQTAINIHFRPDRNSPLADQLVLAADDAAQRLLLPAIERDVRRILAEQSENHAISVFADNLRALLNQPPLAGHTMMGIDPGFRTGCKVTVVDPTGKVLDTATIYPHPPQRQQDAAQKTLVALAVEHGVTLITIGNGTASRETEQLVAELIRTKFSHPKSPVIGLKYLIASEAGASVYSASPLARAELPDMDVSMRGAVSIARRVQDPLAELVKINPKSIGVGMYQHDVDQSQLDEALAGVVESVVNRVGVDVNTASPALLAHVSGIGPKLADRIVAHRDANGPFRSRAALKKVSGLGPKTFEQAAGFLRIRDGDNPLDTSAIHPESYTIAQTVLEHAGLAMQTKPTQREAALLKLQNRLSALADELETGIPTLTDILEQLIRPGRDPRQDLPAPILRSDVLTMDDLRTGMRLKGTVRNVVDFGAFVDVGVKNDGLLHRSQIPRGTRLQVGDVIDIEILRVEPERGRISLGWPGQGNQK